MDMDVLARIRRVNPLMAAEIQQAVVRREAVAALRAVRLGRMRGAQGGTDPIRVLVHGQDNAKVVIVADEGTKGLIATSDPHDGAHSRMDPCGKYVSSAVGSGKPGHPRRLGKHAKARQYPPSHFGTAGVAIDSSFDAAYERAEWIREELGIDLVGMSTATAVDKATDRIASEGRKVWQVAIKKVRQKDLPRIV